MLPKARFCLRTGSFSKHFYMKFTVLSDMYKSPAISALEGFIINEKRASLGTRPCFQLQKKPFFVAPESNRQIQLVIACEKWVN